MLYRKHVHAHLVGIWMYMWGLGFFCRFWACLLLTVPQLRQENPAELRGLRWSAWRQPRGGSLATLSKNEEADDEEAAPAPARSDTSTQASSVPPGQRSVVRIGGGESFMGSRT